MSAGVNGEVRIMEYILNALNAASQIGPLQELGDALVRAAGPVMTLAENLSRSLATMDLAVVVVLGAASFIVVFVIGYFALLTA
jgi:uncharacterized protein YggT (Ycf19 family)